MPRLVLSFQYIPKAAYYFSKNSGTFCQDEPKKYKEQPARVSIDNQTKSLFSMAKNTRFSGYRWTFSSVQIESKVNKDGDDTIDFKIDEQQLKCIKHLTVLLRVSQYSYLLLIICYCYWFLYNLVWTPCTNTGFEKIKTMIKCCSGQHP